LTFRSNAFRMDFRTRCPRKFGIVDYLIMQLTLDPETVRSLIELRRAATDIKLPMHERLKVQFMTRRAQLLSNFSLTAGAWMILLHGCKVQARDKAELESLMADVLAFKDWAEEGLQALRRMGLQEVIEDGDSEMPDDPQLVAAMRKMLGISDPKPPDPH